MAEENTYIIGLDGDWSLADFYELPHTFAQVYAFHYAFRPGTEVRDRDRLAYAFASYPWRGGYSAVNFYIVLSSQIPRGLRPNVVSIRYASPGWFEVSLLVGAALSVGKVVNVFVTSAASLNKLYTEIHEGLHTRKLLRVEAERKRLELARDELNFVVQSSHLLAQALGFDSLKELNKLTESPLATLKILLSYYRRVRTLAEYAKEGKAVFPEENR
jgi:hypothetical protein